MSSTQPAWRDPLLRRLAGSRFASQLADWLAAAALVGWIYERTGSTAQVALLMFVRLAPPVLGGGLAAPIVDRLPKGRLLVHLELARAGAFAAAFAGVGSGSRPAIFAAVFVTGALGTVGSATASALVPTLVEDAQLPAANAFIGVTSELAVAVGTLGAGTLLAFFDPQAALAGATLAAAAAALCLSSLRPAGLPKRATGTARTGLRALLGRRLLVGAIGSFVLATLATMLAGATLPRFLGSELGLGAGAYGFGIGALAIGLAAGQALGGRVPRLAGSILGIALPLFATAALFVLLSRAPSAWTALVLLGCVGLSDGVSEVSFQTVVQREAGPELVGLAFGFASTLIKASSMGALALAPLVNGIGSPRNAILFGAIPLALGGIAALSARPRRTGAAPVPAPAQ